jgi:predicted transcriptional regulator/DNA-binding CsgD family transcriptional regulator
MSVLGVWGLDDEAEALYRTLLRNPDRDADWYATHLERDRQQIESELAALVDVGLARQDGAAFSAGPPATTLYPRVNAELTDIDARRAQLDAVRASLASYAADHFVGRSRSWAEVPFELLSDAESYVAIEDLQRSTRGEVMTCHPVANLGSDSPPYTELLHRQLAAGRPMRGLYPSDVVNDPERLAYVRHWSGAGEQVRLTAQLPPRMAVFGSNVALVSSGWGGGPATGFILVRAPALVALVSDLFARYWERAFPMPTSASADDRTNHHERNERLEILEGLMLGAKDETLARQLGVSLRTVRRRVADLMDELGASTRFQAGMEAVRRGLL